MPRIVTIQFSTAGKMYDFTVGDIEIAPRTQVVVETDRGIGVATVVRGPVERNDAETLHNLSPIVRIANAEDLDILAQNARKETDAYDFCNRRIIERNMQMKLVRVEYLFDGSKAVFYFTADGRVDFRDLVKDLAHTFHTRIEMRQIGVRDESKMVGGIGICGRELCCCSWLRDFQPVSVKMAKEQNLALNPNKISGQCGRLLCCLDYEYETYCSLRKTFPKCGKRVRTESVVGMVDKLNILTGNISLKMDDGKIVIIKKTEIIGEASAADSIPVPQQAESSTAGNRSQKSRDRRPERQERPRRTEQKAQPAVAGSPASAATPAASAKPGVTAETKTGGDNRTADGQPRPPRKKHRSRKHGHRKPGEGGSNENTPPPAS